MAGLFAGRRLEVVVHLAAQVGVCYALANPCAYIDANLTGFSHVLEGYREQKTGHMVFASSSSVYGASTKLPYSENDNVDHPVSLYAGIKKANELMAHSYANLHRLPCLDCAFLPSTILGVPRHSDIQIYAEHTRRTAHSGLQSRKHDP